MFQVNVVPAATDDKSFKCDISYLELWEPCITILVCVALFEGCRVGGEDDITQTVASLNERAPKHTTAFKWLKYGFNCFSKQCIRVSLLCSAGTTNLLADALTG